MGMVTLMFITEEDLLNFISHVGATFFSFYIDSQTLLCEESDPELELAIKGFHAKIII